MGLDRVTAARRTTVGWVFAAITDGPTEASSTTFAERTGAPCSAGSAAVSCGEGDLVSTLAVVEVNAVGFDSDHLLIVSPMPTTSASVPAAAILQLPLLEVLLGSSVETNKL